MNTTSNRGIAEPVAMDRVEALNAELLDARWEVDFLNKAVASGRGSAGYHPGPCALPAQRS